MDYRVFWGGIAAWALLWVALCINTIVSLDLLWVRPIRFRVSPCLCLHLYLPICLSRVSFGFSLQR